MVDGARTPGSPGWWLLRLGARLTAQQPRFDLLAAYHSGNHPLPFGNQKMREAYRRLQKQARSNYCGLVSETLLERMKVVGFRAGAQKGQEVDTEAWGWWQANKLDANSGLIHRSAVVLSQSYVIVGQNPKNPSMPLVTGEDPRQVIHESDPADRYTIRAALKVWHDDVEAADLAILYMPDAVYYFRSIAPIATADEPWSESNWVPNVSNLYPEATAPNPLGEVPVVPFSNRPDLAGNCLGEFEDVLDVQDRINTTVLDRLVTSAMQAYRQRWGKGVSNTDENGNTVNGFDPGADLMWTVEDENAAFGEFGATDLRPILAGTESDVQHLAAITRTPPHYLIGAVVNVSGDALAAAETGLVSKARERMVEFGESWEQVYRLAGKVQGRPIGDDAEVVWTDPEFRTLTEKAAANVQLAAAGVPWRTRMELLDFTPTEIARMDAERVHDALLSASLAPLSVAEGGQLGSRGVLFNGNPILTDQQTPRLPGTKAEPAAAPPPSTPAAAGAPTATVVRKNP